MTKQRLSSLDSPSAIPANLLNLDLSLAIDKFRPGVHSVEELQPVLSVVKRTQNKKKPSNTRKPNPRCVSMPILPRTLKLIQENKLLEGKEDEKNQISQYKPKELPQLPKVLKFAPLPTPPILSPPKRKTSHKKIMHKSTSRSVSMFPLSYNLSTTYMDIPTGPVNYTSPTQNNNNNIVDDIVVDDLSVDGCEVETKSNFNTKFKPVSKSGSIKTHRSASASARASMRGSGRTSTDLSTTDSYDSELDSDSGSLLSLTLTKSALQNNYTPPIPSGSQFQKGLDTSKPRYIIVDDDDEEESMLSDITISHGNVRINGSKDISGVESEVTSSSSCSSDSSSCGSTSSSLYSDSDDDLSTDLSTDLGSTTDDMTELDLTTLDLDYLELDCTLIRSDITVTRKLLQASKSSEKSSQSTASKPGSVSSETPTLKNEKLLRFVESYLVNGPDDSESREASPELEHVLIQIEHASDEVDSKVNEVIGNLYADNESQCKSSFEAPSSYNDSLFSYKSSAKISYRDNHEPSPLTKELPLTPTPAKVPQPEPVVRRASLIEVAQLPQKFVTIKPLPPSTEEEPIPVENKHASPQGLNYTPPRQSHAFDALDWSPEIQPFTVAEDISKSETQPLNIKKTRKPVSNSNSSHRLSTQSYTSVSSTATTSFKDATQSLKEHVRQRPFSFTLDSGKDYSMSRYFSPIPQTKGRSVSDFKRNSAPSTANNSATLMIHSTSNSRIAANGAKERRSVSDFHRVNPPTTASNSSSQMYHNDSANSTGNIKTRSVTSFYKMDNFKSLAPPRPVVKDKRWVSEFSSKPKVQNSTPSVHHLNGSKNSIDVIYNDPTKESAALPTKENWASSLRVTEEVSASPRSRQNRFGDRERFRHTSLPLYR